MKGIKFENLGSVGPGTLWVASRNGVQVSMVHNGGCPKVELVSMLREVEKRNG